MSLSNRFISSANCLAAEANCSSNCKGSKRAEQKWMNWKSVKNSSQKRLSFFSSSSAFKEASVRAYKVFLSSSNRLITSSVSSFGVSFVFLSCHSLHETASVFFFFFEAYLTAGTPGFVASCLINSAMDCQSPRGASREAYAAGARREGGTITCGERLPPQIHRPR